MASSRTPSRVGRGALILVAGAVTAVVANAVVAVSALSAGAKPGFAPLSFPVYGAFTVAGFALGFVGWRLIQRRARHPRPILRVLVPAVLVVSFVPDIGVLVSGAIPATSGLGVAALMIMHLVVAAVAVPVYERVAPVARPLASVRTAVAA